MTSWSWRLLGVVDSGSSINYLYHGEIYFTRPRTADALAVNSGRRQRGEEAAMVNKRAAPGQPGRQAPSDPTPSGPAPAGPPPSGPATSGPGTQHSLIRLLQEFT